MFSKLLQKLIPAFVLIGALILVSCDSVTQAIPDQASTEPDVTVPEGEAPSAPLVLNPDQEGAEPDASVPERAAPDEGEFGVPSNNISDGRITVLLSAPEYKKGESIAITISNGLDQTIYSVDMKTGCSIVKLEKWNGSGWEALLECGMERSPFVFAIGPTLERSALLDPKSSAFGITKLQEPFLDVGTYRILFTYRLEPGREGDEPLSVYSEEFDIVP